MFFTTAVENDEYNFQTLMYCVKPDGGNWSDAKPVYTQASGEAKTNDNAFEAYSDGTNIYVTFTKSNTALTQDTALNPDGSVNIANTSKLDVYVGTMNTEKNDFNISRLTNDNTYDISWTGNVNNNPYGLEGLTL